jgi:hypothetical protein
MPQPQSQHTEGFAAMRIAQAESAIILQNLADGQSAILAKLDGHERCVKAQGKMLVALETWRTEHVARHKREGDAVRSLRARINAIGAGNAALTAVGSFLAGLIGQQN